MSSKHLDIDRYLIFVLVSRFHNSIFIETIQWGGIESTQ